MIDLNTNLANAKADTVKSPALASNRIVVPGAGRQVIDDYNEVNVLELESVKVAKIESWIAKAVGTKLMEAYPNRQWGVLVDVEGQMIVIMCQSVSQEKGFHISMVGRCVHDLQLEGVKAGGEILERYNLSRKRKFDADILETLDRDSRDEVISSDAAPGAQTKVFDS